MLSDHKNEKFDVVIVAGQSNAQGCGAGDAEDYEEDPSVLELTESFTADVAKTAYGNEYLDIRLSGEYDINVMKQKGDGKAKTGSFAYKFAELYRKNDLKRGRKLLIVQAAVGGTGFSKNHWGVGEILYERLLKMTEIALSLNKDNRLVCVLWHQGEHDTFENPQFTYAERRAFYAGKLKDMTESFFANFGKVPFIAAGFTRLWTEEYPSQCKAVYDAYADVMKEDGNIKFVKTDDLLSNKEKVGGSDQVHFCRDALNALGERYYAEYSRR
ncbi:MAG TPA: hypothetical protein DDW54_01165 [Clostridiales bacterium]|nr:hypothetical protein [Clostridiales bacterium]